MPLRLQNTNAFSGRPDLLPRRPARRDHALAVVGLVARQPHDLLRVVDLVLGRNDDVVGDEIVVVRRAHGAGIAEPVDVHRRGPAGEHLGARILGVAVEIDQDVDAVGRDLRRRLIVGHAGDVGPVIDAGLGAGLRRVGPVDPAVIGEDLEVLAVVLLDDVGHGKADRMLAQVGRHIADPQPQRIAPPCPRLDMRRAPASACRWSAWRSARPWQAGTSDRR